MDRIGAKSLGRDFALTSEIWVQPNRAVVVLMVSGEGRWVCSIALPVCSIAPLLRISGLVFISDHWAVPPSAYLLPFE